MANELIEVFKHTDPNRKLFADQKQINANPKSLIRWDQREAWLKANADGGEKTKQATGEGGDADEKKDTDTETKTDTKPQRTKADIQAELDAAGIPYTKKMTAEQLEKALAEGK